MILDTNALSALAKGDPELIRALGTETLFLPTIVLGEYRFGLKGSKRRSQMEDWLDDLLTNVSVLTIDQETARHYADLRHHLKTVGKPVPGNDLWIGSLALQHRLPIVTRDQHFAVMPNVLGFAW